MCDDIQQLLNISNCSFHISDVKVIHNAIVMLKVISGLYFDILGSSRGFNCKANQIISLWTIFFSLNSIYVLASLHVLKVLGLLKGRVFYQHCYHSCLISIAPSFCEGIHVMYPGGCFTKTLSRT